MERDEAMPTEPYPKTRRKDGSPAYLHTLAAEKKLGRRLRRGEIVHHVHGDKAKRGATTRVITRAEHNRHHHAVHPTRKKCAICGAMFTPPPTHRARAQVCSKPGCQHQILSRRAKARGG